MQQAMRVRGKKGERIPRKGYDGSDWHARRHPKERTVRHMGEHQKGRKMLQMKVCKKVDEQAYVKQLTASGSNIDSLVRVGIDSGELA
jgi:hypothetical protein